MASARVWAKRVAGWRASGLSADAYAAGRGFAGSTLRWWSSQLNTGARAAARPNSSEVRIAQVVRTPRPAAMQGVIVELRGARVLVPPGVDEATLASVIAALGGAS